MYAYPKTVNGNDQLKHGSSSCNLCLPEGIYSTRLCCRCKEQQSVDFMVKLRHTDPHEELVLADGLVGTGLKCVVAFCTEMTMKFVGKNQSNLNNRVERVLDQMANKFSFLNYFIIELSECSPYRVSSQ